MWRLKNCCIKWAWWSECLFQKVTSASNPQFHCWRGGFRCCYPIWQSFCLKHTEALRQITTLERLQNSWKELCWNYYTCLSYWEKMDTKNYKDNLIRRRFWQCGSEIFPWTICEEVWWFSAGTFCSYSLFPVNLSLDYVCFSQHRSGFLSQKQMPRRHDNWNKKHFWTDICRELRCQCDTYCCNGVEGRGSPPECVYVFVYVCLTVWVYISPL